MSAFMISEECMGNIINGLYWTHDFKNLYSGVYKEKNLFEEKDFESLAESLFLLNQSALIQRYPNDKADSDYIQIPKFKWKDKTISIYQFLKSVQCLKYQCTEGDIPEKNLYKWLDELEKCLMSFIINRIPEYDKAKWN